MKLSETEVDKLVWGHFERDPDAIVRSQLSGRIDIESLLKQASKKLGGTGRGAPDIMVWSDKRPDLLIITENKRSQADHESVSGDNVSRFAVDGALHYASFLSAKFDVIAIAVSGTQANALRISTFRWLKGEKHYEALVERSGRPLERLLSTVEDYAKLLTYDPSTHERTISQLNAIGRQLNDYLRNIGLDDKKKPLLVSATLLALRDDAFRIGYPKKRNSELPRYFLEALRSQLENMAMPGIKRDILVSAFSFVESDGLISGNDEISPLRYVIGRVENEVLPHTYDNEEIDAVGSFYQEFLRYRGQDQKNKGIVLTPRHITELFAEIADVRDHQTVLDPCAGSGGFLIAAMARMDSLALDEERRQHIRSKQLIGVELETEMFALAAVNMILRGDGKSNLYLGSCFDPKIIAEISIKNANHERPQVGLINPPYAMDKKTNAKDERGQVIIDSGKNELEFIEEMLDCLEPGGTGVAIVPTSCAIGMDNKSKELRRRILSKHTLDAVMTMPSEVFYPTATHTCIMVFKAGDRHDNAQRQTWFGYWKDDGYVKTRGLGRIDRYRQWPSIRNHWLDLYSSRISSPGESVVHTVGPNDEWIAEAYMETDFSKIVKDDFEHVLLGYNAFILKSQKDIAEPPKETLFLNHPLPLVSLLPPASAWGAFRYDELFDIKGGTTLAADDQAQGSTPYVTATAENNGISAFVDKDANHSGGVITVASHGSVGSAFYQPWPTLVSGNVRTYYLKNQTLTPAIAMFLCTLIRAEQYRFNYGRVWAEKRMAQSLMRLPITSEGNPDWGLMEQYILNLPYSAVLIAGSSVFAEAKRSALYVAI